MTGTFETEILFEENCRRVLAEALRTHEIADAFSAEERIGINEENFPVEQFYCCVDAIWPVVREIVWDSLQNLKLNQIAKKK